MFLFIKFKYLLFILQAVRLASAVRSASRVNNNPGIDLAKNDNVNDFTESKNGSHVIV